MMDELDQLEATLHRINALKNEAVKAKEYEQAAKLRDSEIKLLARRAELLQRLPPSPPMPGEK